MRAPVGIESMAPGPELAAVLAGLPVERVANGDVVRVMVAAHRLATHVRAEFLRWVREVAIRLPGPDDQVRRATTAEVDEFTADEIAAALGWSRTRAQNTLGLAVELAERLPTVGDAMLAGRIDEPRAKAFCDWTAGLSAEHADAVVEHVLPDAPGMTVGQIRDAVARTAIALDPDWAQRRYEESVSRRKVVLSKCPEGTATLAGHELPADRAVSGHSRIATLARRCKRAGDGRPIDLIRADLYLGMLDGTLHELTDRQIIAYILTHPVAGDPTSDPDAGGDDESGDDESGDEEGGDGPGDGEGPSDNGSAGTGGGASDDCAAGSTIGAIPLADSVWRPAELRVRVGTLLELNDHPAELPGFGYVPASVARQLVTGMAGGQWRYVVCTPSGHPIATELLRARPTTADAPAQKRDVRGGLVELQLTTDELATIVPGIIGDTTHAWARVLREIAIAAAADDANTGTSADVCASPGADSGADTSAGSNTSTDVAYRTTVNPRATVAGSADGRDRRYANARLRRWIQVRDRSCLFPLCRAPSRQSDQDHRIDHAAGGPTTEQNLNSLCRHHHRLKHDGGWQLHQREPNTWTWTSRLGRSYRAQPPPVMPPLPVPAG